LNHDRKGRMKSSKEIIIRVQDLSKYYQVYDKPHDRLKQSIYPRLQEMIGKKPKQYYRNFRALEGVSFEVEKGETLGIIGLNGSGKSTLLQIICGTLSPTGGSTQVNGRIAALLELGSGFNAEFTGRENVFMNATLFGLSNEEIEERFADIAAFADIGDFIDQPVKKYSSGMYVRLAFAVIANVAADILIIDEALAVGDMLFKQKCMRFLRNFRENGTVLFVSHNSSAVVSLCDRAVWLDQGQVQNVGPAKDVCEQYFARRYQSKISTTLHPENKKEIAVKPEQHALSDEKFQQYRDMRRDFINNSNLRNDIQIFEFSSVKKSFGNNKATILYAGLQDLDGEKLSWIVGGEMARIVIEAKVHSECENIIIGFNVKDSLGQVLFMQNTFVDTLQTPVKTKSGDTVEAIFTFRLPILPKGSYSVDVAIADGIPPDVVHLQWGYDVFLLESQSSSIMGGLIGILFDNIELHNKCKGMGNSSK
jgi:homopolymeric O-antigen transport system ATP-binding protein